MTNYATGNARVGVQADGPVTITGGVTFGADGGMTVGQVTADDGDPADDDAAAVQEGAVNVAAGNDRVGVQAARISGGNTR